MTNWEKALERGFENLPMSPRQDFWVVVNRDNQIIALGGDTKRAYKRRGDAQNAVKKSFRHKIASRAMAILGPYPPHPGYQPTSADMREYRVAHIKYAQESRELREQLNPVMDELVEQAIINHGIRTILISELIHGVH